MFGRKNFHRLSVAVISVLLMPQLSLSSEDGSPTAECERGWLGPNCEYANHCYPSDECLLTNSNPGCQLGWFGPGCQYVDIFNTGTMSTGGTATPEASLDAECGRYSEWIHVTWDDPVFFTWLRLSFKDDIQVFSDIKVTLKETNNNDGTGKTVLDCTNQKTAMVDSKTIDIYCDVDLAITQVNISGPQLTSLCTVYFSGGRNLALKQSTSQSSVFESYTPDLAVDGNKNNNLDMRSCTHTADNDKDPSWSLTFANKQSIQRYILYNRDIVRERLAGFTIEAFDPEGHQVFTYTDTEPSPQPVYKVRSSSIKSEVSFVRISSAQKDGSGYVTLCEVEIFGDSICPPGYYGLRCENQCNCAVKGEQCSLSTGVCPSGCAPGYHRDGCQKRCDQGKWGTGCLQACDYRCHDNQCDHADGHCTNGCRPGFQEPSCTKECKNGTYGKNCGSLCPPQCKARMCDIVTGKCHQCPDGYTGDLCNKVCESGKYGINCQHSCSSQCLNQLCHHENGSCSNCPLGKTGYGCDKDCPSGSYGNNCDMKCPETCGSSGLNKSCDPADGHCLHSCQDGYKGESCNEECPAKTYGASCMSNCSQGCQIKDSLDPTLCHHVTGRCHFECTSGYEGPTCEPVHSQRTWLIAVPVTASFVVISIVAVVLIKRRRSRRSRFVRIHEETDTGLLDEVSDEENLEMDNFINDSDKVIDKNLDLHRFGESLGRQ